MAPGRVRVAKLLRTRSFPGGQRLPALLRREKRRHPLAPHCDPPQRRLHTGSHRPSLGSYFRLRPPRARLASPLPPALFITAAAPFGFARPPSHSSQPPNLRPDPGNPGALRPPSCAGSRSLPGSQPRWAALPAHLPPPLPAPAPALPLLAGIGASLSRSRYLPPTLGLSTALSLSVPVLSAHREALLPLNIPQAGIQCDSQQGIHSMKKLRVSQRERNLWSMVL